MALVFKLKEFIPTIQPVHPVDVERHKLSETSNRRATLPLINKPFAFGFESWQ